MNIGPYTFEEFMDKAAAFHGNPAPGLILGGYMVEEARRGLPEGTLFEALVETPKCLPDAVQLLTLCSVGNGWMRILNLGRYALTLYDKYTGQGFRVHIDLAKCEPWPEIRAWLLKLKPKAEQSKERLLDEIRRAGPSILAVRPVTVAQKYLGKRHMGGVGICPVCAEAYPSKDGGICRGCQGEDPVRDEAAERVQDRPRLTPVPVEQAVGRIALHDMTRIVPGQDKGPLVKAGQVITEDDIDKLRAIGRFTVHVAPKDAVPSDFVHEDEAALAFAGLMAGDGVTFKTPPREGKIEFFAAIDGVLSLDLAALTRFNNLPDVICATRQNNLMVEKDRPVAACRAIPLFLSRKSLETAKAALLPGPLLRVLPVKPAKVAILVTGAEVFKGLIEDKFIPIVTDKVANLGCTVVASAIADDDRTQIAALARSMVDAGAELIVTTAGLSVDPGDVTRQGLMDAGLSDAVYGAPILPGSMLLLGGIGPARVIGVPACALYHKTTAFDLILPRVLAGQEIARADLAAMAEGGLCLQCKACTFPKCPFGK